MPSNHLYLSLISIILTKKNITENRHPHMSLTNQNNPWAPLNQSFLDIPEFLSSLFNFPKDQITEFNLRIA